MGWGLGRVCITRVGLHSDDVVGVEGLGQFSWVETAMLKSEREDLVEVG